jgi:hypothetical protein
LPEDAVPRLNLQLSSPIEEIVLKEIHDATAETPPVVATFAGVEMGQATLTVTASDATIPLGSSISYDLAELIQMDVMEPVSEYVNELVVAILPGTAGTNEAAPDELVTTTVCTVSLKLTYAPSPKDQREELYEILNKATQRKAKALEKLKQMAAAAARSQGASASSASDGTSTNKKPAMQSGFLNKPKKVVHWSVQWYNKHLGPTSMLQTVLPIAKNYIIFFAAVGFFHFKGQMLALPPPV